MVVTVAQARGNRKAKMHCSRGCEFLLEEAYEDDYGCWCPHDGNSASTGPLPKSSHKEEKSDKK